MNVANIFYIIAAILFVLAAFSVFAPAIYLGLLCFVLGHMVFNKV